MRNLVILRDQVTIPSIELVCGDSLKRVSPSLNFTPWTQHFLKSDYVCDLKVNLIWFIIHQLCSTSVVKSFPCVGEKSINLSRLVVTGERANITGLRCGCCNRWRDTGSSTQCLNSLQELSYLVDQGSNPLLEVLLWHEISLASCGNNSWHNKNKKSKEKCFCWKRVSDWSCLISKKVSSLNNAQILSHAKTCSC